MSRGMFARLAVTNIRKNKGTYLPYMLICMFCISMMYIMLFILANKGMNSLPCAADVRMIMILGIVVVSIFSLIFLLYSNGFLMKRRQKEIGLYNVLGMEKGHIAKMMFVETVMTSVISLAGGIFLGILISKLALLILLKLIHVPAQFGFYVSGNGIVICMVEFGAVFFLTLLNNLRRVHVSRPAELLKGSNVGEREPKAKWLMALIGFLCLGSGYYIAVTTESPLEALPMFFLAVLLVMAGTYLVFTAGSIVILKMLRWKKSFYYKTRNFTSISGMLYRMKQNAVGLASICILSTGVLLMLSSTVCLNFGIDDILHYRYPMDVMASIRFCALEQTRNIRDEILRSLVEEKITCEDIKEQFSLDISYVRENGELVFRSPEFIGEITSGVISVIPLEEYQRAGGEKAALQNGEVLCYSEYDTDEIRIMGERFRIKERLKKWPLDSSYSFYGEICALVVTEEDYRLLDRIQREVYGENASQPSLEIGINLPGEETEEAKCVEKINQCIRRLRENSIIPENGYAVGESRSENYVTAYSLYGGLFFLGILLGSVFLMGTAIIIYYKQMSEGYEDKGRFEIMRKVGMSRKEVRASIHRQILMVFFLPLLMAVLHIAMAFPMIKRLLMLLGMVNTKLFIWCTAGTILVFAFVYAAIYGLTARSYYRILEKAE